MLRALFALVLLCSAPLAAAGENERLARILHLLDYMAVDYPGTVAEGRVTNEGEYAEMVEFSQRAGELIAALPPRQAQARLQARARHVARLIRERAAPDQVVAALADLRQALLRAYPVRLAPRRTPDLERGARLYARQCASCHGLQGRGDGPAAAGLDPAPIDFHDAGRAGARSLLGLYNAITLGVEGTAMRGYAELSDTERWNLAFYVGAMAFPPPAEDAARELLADPALAPLRSLEQLVQLTPDEAGRRFGDGGRALMAWLRHHPQDAARADQADHVATALKLLEASREAYAAGDARTAYQLALRAYLEGFELAEPALRSLDADLLRETEAAMLRHRKLIHDGADAAQVEAARAEAVAALKRVRQTLGEGALSPAAAFVAAAVILLREGLEAILLLAAIATVLIRADRRDALRYLHMGWIAALALGGVTWWISSYVVEISGAGRELTEGLTALAATAVLLYVGFWLHSKTHTQRWQAYVREKIHAALHGRALWLLAGVAFLAVYREAFETVLFYQALWLQLEPGAENAVWSGIGAAAAGLAVLAWVILRSSMRLPLKLFFNVNSFIMLLLAFAFAGHGVAALQEAGMLPADPVRFFRFELLGIYPTLQTLLAQAGVVAFIAAMFAWEQRRNARLQVAGGK